MCTIHGVLLSSLLDTPGFTERGGAEIQLIKTVSQLVCIIMLSFRSQTHAPLGLCKYAVCPLPPHRIVIQTPCPSVDQFQNFLLPNIPFKTSQNVSLNTSQTNQNAQAEHKCQDSVNCNCRSFSVVLLRAVLSSSAGGVSYWSLNCMVIFSHTSRLQREACVIHWC